MPSVVKRNVKIANYLICLNCLHLAQINTHPKKMVEKSAKKRAFLQTFAKDRSKNDQKCTRNSRFAPPNSGFAPSSVTANRRAAAQAARPNSRDTRNELTLSKDRLIEKPKKVRHLVRHLRKFFSYKPLHSPYYSSAHSLCPPDKTIRKPQKTP